MSVKVITAEIIDDVRMALRTDLHFLSRTKKMFGTALPTISTAEGLVKIRLSRLEAVTKARLKISPFCHGWTEEDIEGAWKEVLEGAAEAGPFEVEQSQYFECSCHSDEHRLSFIYFKEQVKDWREVYCSIFLDNSSFFNRLVTGIRYILGMTTSRYGHFHTWTLKDDDIDRMICVLAAYRKDMDAEYGQQKGEQK